LWEGPFPCHRGDFVGNFQRDELTPKNRRGRRIGKPAGKLGLKLKQRKVSSEYFAGGGIVGLYLTHTQTWETKVPTYRLVESDVLSEAVVSGTRPPRKPFRPGVKIKKFL
jgi:hypothetical protein